MRNRALQTVLLIPFLALAARAAHAAEWATTTSEGGGFSLEMPGTPTEQKQTWPTEAGGVDTVIYMLSLDENVAYLAAYSDFTKAQLAGRKIEELLDGARDGAVKNVDGKLVKETKITIDGHPGRELVIEAGDELVVQVRAYLVKTRLIQAMVVMPKKGLVQGDIDRFLKSLKLLKKKSK